jgi:hypothetical protein
MGDQAMTTQAIMKARIADELARTDLTSQIAYAIGDAIVAYESTRWHFNEGRAVTFTTVAGQEFYTSSDAAALATIVKLDYVVIYNGDQPRHLLPMRPAEIEAASTNATNTGEPGWFCWYGNAFRLYPTPATTGQTVRIGAFIKTAAPATDAEASNAWMTHAERLIRSRAKLELALHVLKDQELAGTMNIAVSEAYDQLKTRTYQLTQVGEGRIVPMEF